MDYEITPCRNCTIKDGYGGEYRCSICELTKLRVENERLTNKIKKEQERKKEFSRSKNYGKIKS